MRMVRNVQRLIRPTVCGPPITILRGREDHTEPKELRLNREQSIHTYKRTILSVQAKRIKCPRRKILKLHHIPHRHLWTSLAYNEPSASSPSPWVAWVNVVFIVSDLNSGALATNDSSDDASIEYPAPSFSLPFPFPLPPSCSSTGDEADGSETILDPTLIWREPNSTGTVRLGFADADEDGVGVAGG